MSNLTTSMGAFNKSLPSFAIVGLDAFPTVFSPSAQGTNAAAVRGALRANQTDLLTVVLPQSFEKQTTESQELLSKVKNIIAFPERDELSLEMASRLCNSFMLNQTDQLISFAFHESSTVIEAVDEAKEKKKLVTMLFLD